MRKIVVKTEAPRIEINGIEFEYRMDDGEMYWAGRDALGRCAALDIGDEKAILEALRMICTVIDDALGRGAMEKIMGGRPVSMSAALKVLNGIMNDCNARYAAYLRSEYTGGGGEDA